MSRPLPRMKRLVASPLHDDPRERELDRLLDLRIAGFLTKAEYEQEKRALEHAIAKEAAR